MPKITISLDEELLKSGRRYAQIHQTSLNAIIRKLLQQTVMFQSEDWLEDTFRLMDRAGGNSKGHKWNREDLYTDN